MARWTVRGTHVGMFEGNAPIGKQITYMGMTIQRFIEGKIVDGWTCFDAVSLLQQVGAIPVPERA